MARWPYKKGFFDKKMYGRFARPKKSGRNNEVTAVKEFVSEYLRPF